MIDDDPDLHPLYPAEEPLVVKPVGDEHYTIPLVQPACSTASLFALHGKQPTIWEEESDMADKEKHLEMIQDCISRMARNSFLLKGWTVTLVSALAALAAKDSDVHFLITACFPVLMFWVLDAYYLWQERLFRKLYDDVRIKQADQIDYSMSTENFKSETTWPKAFFGSVSTTGFYPVIAVLVLVLWRMKNELGTGGC